MEKVFITKVLKGKEPAKSVGFIDTAAKKLYVPFLSKKGMPLIDVVDIDYLNKVENGYRCETIVYDDEDRHFVNVYYATKLNKESEVK
jgi:hypothetical protein